MDVPQVIAGRFRIEREIGTGGMGTVYLATHLGLERPVAVKIIKREFAGDRDVAQRFLREARTMAKLRHQNAATIFDAGNLPDGRYFIIMMRLIQQRYYVPNNSALVVTGDVTSSDVVKMAQEFYGDWARREKDPFVEFPLVEHPPLTKSEGAVITSPVQNVIISVGWHGPSIGKDNPATYAADVFSFIIRQPNSRFQRNLVDTGLVTGVDLGYYTQRNVGPIQLVAQTTPEKAHGTAF